MKRWIEKAKTNKKILMRITGVLLAVIAVCAYMFIGHMATITKADGIPQSVTIGGKTYTAENKLHVLEIVPDVAYDELGLIIGDDQGSITWKSLVDKAPKGSSKQSELSTYISNYVNPYNNFMSNLCRNSGFYLKFKNKNTGKIYGDSWSINLSEINYNLNNVEIVACKQDSNWQYYEYKTDDGASIRNIFAYIIFGSIAMEDKMDLTVMKANDVTKADIDAADLVYINGKSHDGTMISLYNKINNTSVSSSLQWELNSIDMNAEVAYYLYESNVRRGKALIMGSTDKNSTNGTYSNVSRIAVLQCAIDGDTFIGDFAYSKKSNSKYTGSMGEVRIDSGVLNVYLYTEAGTKQIPFSSTMFINSMVIDGKYGYAPNGNNASYYPAYNATDNRFQSYMNKYTYVFNSDNFMTSSLSSAIGSKSDYDSDGHYLGSSYDDAATRLNKDKASITSGNAICYILGDYSKSNISSINVLEIEPIGIYRYNDDNDKEAIKKWFGLSSEDSVTINIEQVSMNAFVGMNSDIWSDYDLIIVGGYTDGKIYQEVWGKTYNTGNETYGLNGNDITAKAYEKLVKYAKTGLPIVMDDSVYYGDTTEVDDDTRVFNLRTKNFVNELLNTNSSAGNITHVNVSEETGYQSVPRTLVYKVKPDANMACNLPEYTGVGSALANRSQLGNVTFSGNVGGAGNYRVKIYIDRSCDGIFAEDYDSDAAELLFFAKDGNEPLRDAAGNILGGYSSGGDYSVSLALPSALSGYIAWKVEVTNTDTGLIKCKEGAFAIQSYTVGRTINVLQIVSDDSSNPENLNLEDGSAFRQCFDAATATTGLSIEVTKITKSYLNSITTDKNEFLSNYSMLVLGLSDNYGNDYLYGGSNKNFNSDSINAIKNYINKGNAVLFTHDTMSYKKISGNSLVEAGSVSSLNEFTRTFKDIIGVKSGYSLTDTLRYKLQSKTPFTDIAATGSTRTTNKVNKLNKGEITEYPYKLSGKELDISTTHGQYFALNLEEFNGTSSPYSDDVVVWYTLGETTGNQNSKYYTYTGQDAKNNYYVYSKGNITYSSAGHSSINSNNDEMKLFVNTFVRAMLSGNALPEATYEEATQESPTLFTKYFRTDLSGYKDSLSIDFSVNDPDLVDNIGRLTTCYLFYDKNNNDEFDSSDVIIGYFDKDGNISTTRPAGKSIYSAKKYTFELWSAVEGLNNSNLTTEMKGKLVNNKLRIGIVATDASEASGYAVLKIVERNLFRLN